MVDNDGFEPNWNRYRVEDYKDMSAEEQERYRISFYGHEYLQGFQLRYELFISDELLALPRKEDKDGKKCIRETYLIDEINDFMNIEREKYLTPLKVQIGGVMGKLPLDIFPNEDINNKEGAPQNIIESLTPKEQMAVAKIGKHIAEYYKVSFVDVLDSISKNRKIIEYRKGFYVEGNIIEEVTENAYDGFNDRRDEYENDTAADYTDSQTRDKYYGKK